MKSVLIFLASLSLSSWGMTGIIATVSDLSAVRAYPNPWRADQHASSPEMTFDHLPDSAVSTVKIFTLSGELVRTVTGTQTLRWDLRNDSGQRVASGVYLYLLSSNNLEKSGKIVVIR